MKLYVMQKAEAEIQVQVWPSGCFSLPHMIYIYVYMYIYIYMYVVLLATGRTVPHSYCHTHHLRLLLGLAVLPH
jgi:hypothetical protein